MTLPVPTLLQAYCEALRRHAHEFISIGYQRMDKAAFAKQKEPAITGELVREMRTFMESGHGAPFWVLTHGEAGMLGYVQSDSEEAWAEKIASRFSADPQAYGIVPPPIARQRIVPGLQHTWVSRHRRSAGGDTVVVFHVMLRFML